MFNIFLFLFSFHFFFLYFHRKSNRDLNLENKPLSILFSVFIHSASKLTSCFCCCWIKSQNDSKIWWIFFIRRCFSIAFHSTSRFHVDFFTSEMHSIYEFVDFVQCKWFDGVWLWHKNHVESFTKTPINHNPIHIFAFKILNCFFFIHRTTKPKIESLCARALRLRHKVTSTYSWKRLSHFFLFLRRKRFFFLRYHKRSLGLDIPRYFVICTDTSALSSGPGVKRRRRKQEEKRKKEPCGNV